MVSASFLFSIPAVLTFSLVGGLHYTPEILNWVPYSALVSSVTPTNFPATLTVSDKSSSSIEVPWRSKRSSAVLFLSEAASWWTFTIIYGGAGKGVKERRLTQQPVQKFRNQYEPWIITLGPRVYESTVNWILIESNQPENKSYFPAKCRTGIQNQILNTTCSSISIWHRVSTLTLFRSFDFNWILII